MERDPVGRTETQKTHESKDNINWMRNAILDGTMDAWIDWGKRRKKVPFENLLKFTKIQLVKKWEEERESYEDYIAWQTYNKKVESYKELSEEDIDEAIHMAFKNGEEEKGLLLMYSTFLVYPGDDFTSSELASTLDRGLEWLIPDYIMNINPENHNYFSEKGKKVAVLMGDMIRGGYLRTRIEIGKMTEDLYRIIYDNKIT